MGDEEKTPRLLQRAGVGEGEAGRVNWRGMGGGARKIKMPLNLQGE